MAPRDRDDSVTGDELRRGERFLAAYTVIEQAMRRKWGSPTGKEAFRYLVDVLAQKDWTIREFKGDLEEFAELRNAIVHERTSPTYLIAVPLPEAVERIERIAAAVYDPPLVYPRFKRDVACLSPDDKMERVFKKVSETGYSQFPVYRGPVYRGLLTDGGIARWVAGVLSAGRAGDAGDRQDRLGDVSVGDVLKSEKRPDRARFVSKKATIYEAEHLFRDAGRGDKWRVSALLITENGSAEEELAGIITPSDVLALSGEWLPDIS